VLTDTYSSRPISRFDNWEIGRELYVSVNTVRSHVQAVYRKLGVSTRAEAVAHARECGLLPGVDVLSPAAITPRMAPADR